MDASTALREARRAGDTVDAKIIRGQAPKYGSRVYPAMSDQTTTAGAIANKTKCEMLNRLGRERKAKNAGATSA
jgi:hypothetical protein